MAPITKADKERGVTGLLEWGGTIREEFLVALDGQKGIQTYREMRDNSPIIGAALLALEMLARRAEVSIEPGGESNADLEAAEFVHTNLDDMSTSWDDTLGEILSMLPFGWSYHEIVYKRRDGWNQKPGSRSYYDDGMLGWRKFPIRAQTSLYKWQMDPSGGVQGMWQMPPSGGPLFIPIIKALLFRPKAHKGNPQGRSFLRNAYTSYFHSTKLTAIEGIGIERELAGYPIFHVPAEEYADTTKRAAWQRAVTRIRKDEQMGMILPSERDEHGNLLYELVLANSGGERQVDADTAIQRHDTRMAQSLLAEFLHVGMNAQGARSTAESKMGLFITAMNTVLESVASTISRHAIPRLVGLNGFAVDLPPKLVFAPLDQDDLLAWSDSVSKLAGAGMPIFPDAARENFALGKLGFPQMSEEELEDRDTEIEEEAKQEEALAEQTAAREDQLAGSVAELNAARATRGGA